MVTARTWGDLPPFAAFRGDLRRGLADPPACASGRAALWRNLAAALAETGVSVKVDSYHGLLGRALWYDAAVSSPGGSEWCVLHGPGMGSDVSAGLYAFVENRGSIHEGIRREVGFPAK